MKFMKIISLLVCCLSLTLCVTPTAFAGENTNKIVILGDSIATGYGLEGYCGVPDSGDGSFGSLLWCGSTDYINLAEDGLNSGMLLEKLSDEKVSDALKNADTTVISIGGNDLLRPAAESLSLLTGKEPNAVKALLSNNRLINALLNDLTEKINKIDLKAVGENISGILEEVKEQNPDTEIYIFTVYDAFRPLGEQYSNLVRLSELADKKLSELCEYTKIAAENHGVNIVDLHSAFRGFENEYTNIGRFDIHPSKAGHRVIFEELKKAGIIQTDIKAEEWFRNLRFKDTEERTADKGNEIYSVSMPESERNRGVCAFVCSDGNFELKFSAYTKDNTEICGFSMPIVNMRADGSLYTASSIKISPYDFIADSDKFEAGDIERYAISVVGECDDGQTFKVGFETFASTMKGDISQNGKIDLRDAIEIAKSLLGKREFTEDEQIIADFNGDSIVDLHDAIEIAKYLLKKS